MEPPVSALYVNVKAAGATGVEIELVQHVAVAQPGPLHDAVFPMVVLP
jgi:hypothetical protein